MNGSNQVNRHQNQNEEHAGRETLKYIYALVPIFVGLDKFTFVLVDWSQYVADILGFIPIWFVGVVEIAAGIIIFFLHPRIGAVIFGLWLLLIAANLFMFGRADLALLFAFLGIFAGALRFFTFATPPSSA